jgi:hypothetical protein
MKRRGKLDNAMEHLRVQRSLMARNLLFSALG